MQSKMRDFGTGLKSIGSTGLKLSGSMAALLAIPIRLAANMEKTRAEFTALIGDAKTANKVISELEGFALVTPLAVSDLADATRTLLNFGVAVEDVVPTIKRLGEISGGDSERMSRLAYAFGQVTAAGRLMGTEVRQFIEAGFNPLQEISRTTGESMESLRQRLEAGQISVDEVARAFQTATGVGGRFNGLLAKIGGTAIGKFNELKETIILAIRPIGDALLPMLNDFMTAVRAMVPAIASWIKKNEAAVRMFAKMAVVIGIASTAAIAIGGALTLLFASPMLVGMAATAAAITAIATALMEVEGAAGRALRALARLGGADPKMIESFDKLNKWLNFGKSPSPSGGAAGGPASGAAPFAAPKEPRSLVQVGRDAIDRAMVSAKAMAMRAQFEAIPVNDMIERAKLAFERMREIGDEGQRLDDEIARTRIEGMQDGLAKEKALLDLEKQIRLRELQEAGLLTPEMRAKLDALFGAQNANAIREAGKAESNMAQQGLFDTRFAAQIFGGSTVEENIAKIARNTDPRNQRQREAGGVAMV
jgi:tape measure domain-containing protein